MLGFGGNLSHFFILLISIKIAYKNGVYTKNTPFFRKESKKGLAQKM